MISFESKRLEIDKNTQDFARDRDSELLALQKNMENEIQRVQVRSTRIQLVTSLLFRINAQNTCNRSNILKE